MEAVVRHVQFLEEFEGDIGLTLCQRQLIPCLLPRPLERPDAKHIRSAEFKVQESVSLFTKPGCSFCAKAKQMLQDRGIQYEEIVLGQDATTVSLRAVTGRATVPQVFIGGRHIGGSDDLEKFFVA